MSTNGHFTKHDLQISQFAAIESNRYTINGISWESQGRLVATDGSMLALVDGVPPHDEESGIILDAQEVLKVARQIKAKETITATIEGDKVKFTLENGATFPVSRIVGSYPKYADLFKIEDADTVRVASMNPNLLANIFKWLPEAREAWAACKIRFQGESRPVFLSCDRERDMHRKYEALVMPMAERRF